MANPKKLKKWFFKTCPKRGCIVGINKKNVILKIFFPLLGFAALVWFLIRVVPKPSRINYPCQQVAAPLAFSFLTFVGSLFAGMGTFRHTRALINSRRWTRAVLVVVCGGIICSGLYVWSIDPLFSQRLSGRQVDDGTSTGIFEPSDSPNSPIGTPRGIHLGRVAWAHDPMAAAWTGSEGYMYSPAYNSQTRVDDMIAGAIISLTDAANVTDAWGQLFANLNKNKGKGSIGYRKGEKIAIKINLNNNGGTNTVDASPQSVMSLLSQLVDSCGVPQSCITVYDAQRRGISAVYSYNHSLFPYVVFQNWGGFVPDVIHYSAEITDSAAMSMARAAWDADYMINMALMKRHTEPSESWKDSNGQTGITATGKNHFGSVGKVPPLHLSIRDWSKWRGMGSYNSIVDLMAHEKLGGNTVVYIVDALYPTPKHNGRAYRSGHQPFNGGYMSSVLASLDQVAIESVVLDFVRSEIPVVANADNFMHEAALIGNPPSGVKYIGRSAGSLGVHEHWNNPTDKQYSRNLGTGNGIELFRVPLYDKRPAVEYFYADRQYVIGNTEAKISWKTSGAERVTINGKKMQPRGEMIVKGGEFLIDVSDGNKKADQRIVLKRFSKIDEYEAEAGEISGSATIAKHSDDGTPIGCTGSGCVVFKSVSGSSKGAVEWSVAAPQDGLYYLIFRYNGTQPVPSYLYLDGVCISENIGYTATDSNRWEEFMFPIELKKGKNSVKLEHAGRSGNYIDKLSVAY